MDIPGADERGSEGLRRRHECGGGGGGDHFWHVGGGGDCPRHHLLGATEAERRWVDSAVFGWGLCNVLVGGW